jgi:chromosome segregation ATPase
MNNQQPDVEINADNAQELVELAINNLREEIKFAQTNTDSANTSIFKFLSGVQESLADIETGIVTRIEDANKVASELETCKNQRSDLETQIHGYEVRLTEMQSQVSTEIQNRDQLIRQLESNIEEMGHSMEKQLQGKIDESTHELNAQIAERNISIASKEDVIAAMQTQIAALQGELERMKLREERLVALLNTAVAELRRTAAEIRKLSLSDQAESSLNQMLAQIERSINNIDFVLAKRPAQAAAAPQRVLQYDAQADDFQQSIPLQQPAKKATSEKTISVDEMINTLSTSTTEAAGKLYTYLLALFPNEDSRRRSFNYASWFGMLKDKGVRDSMVKTILSSRNLFPEYRGGRTTRRKQKRSKSKTCKKRRNTKNTKKHRKKTMKHCTKHRK